MTRLLTLLLLVTGATGLVYEVVLGRFLALELGSSGASHAITLAAFLGGLSGGALIVERFFRKRLAALANPLTVYAALEAAIGVWMLLFPTTTTAVFGAYGHLATGLDPTSWTVVAIKLVAAAVLILPLSGLMGATLPILAVVVVRQQPRQAVAIISRFYAVNAAGAALGAWLAGFWLIERFGLELPLLGGAVLNLGVAFIVWAASRTQRVAAGPDNPESSPVVVRQSDGLPLGLTIVAAGLTGFVTLLYEIVWTRLSGLLLGASVYAFAMMLVVVILGIALGSGAATRLIARGVSPRGVFAVCQAGAALFATLLIARLDRLPAAVYELRGLFAVRPEAYDLWVSLGGGYVMLHFLPSAIALGAAFPALLAAAHAGGAQTDRATAWILGTNTLGNLLGALLGSFVLMPVLGIDGVLAAGAVASLVVCAIAIVRPFSWRLAATPMVLAAAAGLVLAVAWPDLELLYQGLFRESFDEDKTATAQLETMRFGTRVFRQDGTDCSITVHEFRSGRRTFKMNGKTDGSVGGGARGDQMTQILVGHLGFIYRPQVDTAFLVGLGTGQTADAMAVHDLRELTIAELNQGVIDAAPWFAPFNGDILARAGVRLWLTDAREALRSAAEGSIDLYVSEPSNPWVVGVADLYTREYLEQVKSRLSPGGVVVQWVQAYELSDEIVRSIICTVQGVFPHVAVFRLGVGDLAMVASPDPLRADFDALSRWFQNPAILRTLDGAGARNFPQSVDEVALFNLTAPDGTARLCDGFDAPLEARYPRLEYSAPRYVFGKQTARALIRAIDGRAGEPFHSLAADWFALSPPDAARRAQIRAFLESEPYDYERALRGAVQGPERLPAALRFMLSRLPPADAADAPTATRVCAEIQGAADWLLPDFDTVLGPAVPPLRDWVTRCRQKPR